MKQQLAELGWREYIDIPELGVTGIKAKVDTGARTSCIHAFSVTTFEKDQNTWVRFGIHPNQDDTETEIWCEAPVSDQRQVTDSGGHKEMRYVINATLKVGEHEFETELTLTNRDTMRFRMLLGRTAMNNRFFVNPAASYCQLK